MRVSDIARESGVSVQAVYRSIKRLGSRLSGKVQKVNGVTEVSDEAVELIRQSISAAANVTTVKPLPCQAPAPSNAALMARLDEVCRSMLVLVDEVRALRLENDALRLRLAPPQPVREMISRDQVQHDPLEGMSWYRRLMVQLFEPQRMRRYEM